MRHGGLLRAQTHPLRQTKSASEQGFYRERATRIELVLSLGNSTPGLLPNRSERPAERKSGSAEVGEQGRTPMEEYGCAINAPWGALTLSIALPEAVTATLESRASESGMTVDEAVAALVMSIFDESDP
jgi:hypothetical protein